MNYNCHASWTVRLIFQQLMDTFSITLNMCVLNNKGTKHMFFTHRLNELFNVNTMWSVIHILLYLYYNFIHKIHNYWITCYNMIPNKGLPTITPLSVLVMCTYWKCQWPFTIELKRLNTYKQVPVLIYESQYLQVYWCHVVHVYECILYFITMLVFWFISILYICCYNYLELECTFVSKFWIIIHIVYSLWINLNCKYAHPIYIYLFLKLCMLLIQYLKCKLTRVRYNYE